MNSESLCLANVEKTLGSKKILSDVSFSISENEIVGLLGPNGAGKTTAFYIAAGLVFPDHGKVFMNIPSVLASSLGSLNEQSTPTTRAELTSVKAANRSGNSIR